MKSAIVLILILSCSVTATDKKADDLAATVIRSEFHAGYKPLDNSEAELNKAAAANSALRLQYIVLNKVDDPELRICYALRVLEPQILAARRMTAVSGNPTGYRERLEMLLKRQAQLAQQFRDIQKREGRTIESSE